MWSPSQNRLVPGLKSPPPPPSSSSEGLETISTPSIPPSTPLLSLPPDVLTVIAMFLSLPSYLSLRSTSKLTSETLKVNTNADKEYWSIAAGSWMRCRGSEEEEVMGEIGGWSECWSEATVKATHCLPT